MEQILADYSTSISELKRNPSAVIKKAHNSAIAVLNHNVPTAYLVPAKKYEELLNIIDDIELAKIVSKRLKDVGNAVEVDFDSL